MTILSDLDNFYLQHPEPVNECLLALRNIILKQDENITAAWKYRMPFFCYKGKMFCYLWVYKTTHQPYIGIVEGKHIEHPDLITEKRSRIKIMLFDVNEDLPVDTIEGILQQALDLYRSGVIKI
ncbi:MAG: hypothetical protein JWQ34_1214 [Mucilaginibacter sp.]|uniref:DUF1801 domain-containing protein n=1 Tax=Mucilaginibacter sp. TaxID=1882438 RepID=UPI00260C562D|nr:DUF1801 domain-containing protein [Mucilaginibacter sp.]MDB5002989.1 hypothetical protein [Mucilaginibacter sp.]